MKKKKITLIILAIILILVIGGIVAYKILNDENRLTVAENEWINNNNKNVNSINVINDVNVFGNGGKGLFFDFINDLTEEYGIQINPVTYTSDEVSEGLSLGYYFENETSNNNTPFYSDSFVLVGKNEDTIIDISKLSESKIGIIDSQKDYVSSYIRNDKIELIGYETKEKLLEEYNKNDTELKFILVPQMIYLDSILKNNYHILIHLSDAKVYYGLISDGQEFSSIIKKYYSKWNEKNYSEVFNNYELNTFINNLSINSNDIDNLTSKTYKMGIVNNYPYEILSGGSFGGINATYLKKFSDFTGIKFEFSKFKNIEKLNKAINNGDIDLYFDFYEKDNGFQTVNTNIIMNYAVIAPNNNNIVVNGLSSLNNKTIYIADNTKLKQYITTNTKLDVKTYYSEKELKKIIKNKEIIIIDEFSYESYKNNLLSNYNLRYRDKINASYKYKVNNNENLSNLMAKYFETLDDNEMIYEGINNFIVTKKNGTIVGTIAKYILSLLGICLLLFYIAYNKGRKIKIAKKIKKEDKMRFIDQLTSLKNRNYLSENLESWNKNTIYPQAVIVLDLNRLQEINDTLGYEQGDSQIKASANVLIKTQLDRTDIIRTDGNEFVIYMVGYEVKQVTSYIHKLNKEFKKLPFDYGVAIGYSMITDNVKSIEDAINEAVEQVKEQKEKKED